jgi:hypothetical protein
LVPAFGGQDDQWLHRGGVPASATDRSATPVIRRYFLQGGGGGAHHPGTWQIETGVGEKPTSPSREVVANNEGSFKTL